MILQVLGLVGTATLLFICWMLSQAKNTHVFVVVGQDVFRWMTVVLITIIITRCFIMFGLLGQAPARNINSIVFLGVVGGIVWSVQRHGRPD